jgi:bilirubin oxidase
MVIGFSDNSSFYQIASDAGLLTNSVQLSRLTLSPGERAEILVNLSGRTGANVYMKSYGSELPNGVIGASMPFRNNPLNGANFNLLEIRVSAPTANPITTIPSQLSTHSVWAESAANATRSISMTGGFGGIFTLDNQSFDMMRIDHTVNLGHIEVWTLRNTTMMAHPFHIHGNSFYILDRNGVPPAANEQGRKDVVLVHGSEVVRFITKFEDYADSNTPYMYHCHMLPHEDSGMMGQFLVVQNIAVYNAEKQHSAIKLYPNPNIQIYFESIAMKYTTRFYKLSFRIFGVEK